MWNSPHRDSPRRTSRSTKEDFKVHIDADNNLHIEMEKKSENKEGKKHGNSAVFSGTMSRMCIGT